MKKYIKIIISFLLVLALMPGVGTIAFAEENTSNKLTIISSNVAGLPIPSKFDKDGKVVPKTQKIIEDLGYPVILMDTNEFRLIDGSLTCLSLRF